MTNDFLFISNNTLTDYGLSGGDRILIELIKNWSSNYHNALLGSGECFSLLNKYQALKKVKYYQSSPSKTIIRSFTNLNYFFHTLNRTFFGTLSLIKYWSHIKTYRYIYSASDFYPDTIPAFIIKLFHPQSVWIAGFYLFAPKPWQNHNPYRSSFTRFLTGFLYWLTQTLSFFLVHHFSDFVCVTSKPDIKYFLSGNRTINKIIVVRGGVNLQPSQTYLNHHRPSFRNKKYTAVFIGRLHYQKGVMELIDIWRIVCTQLPQSKLAIIGNGQLLSDVQQKIKKLGLSENISLFGFTDGLKKYKIFQSSAIVVHPATYDSGGMATAEAMAWGLPGVSFNLESLKTYYPQGMIKTRCFDLDQFAKNIIKLTSDNKLYSYYSRQAIDLIEDHWSWKSRSNDIITQIKLFS